VLAIFLHSEGIILAGAWAGIIALLGIPIGILGVWLAWPRDQDDIPSRGESPGDRIQHNIASQNGTIFAVQDGHQSIKYYPPPPPVVDDDDDDLRAT
jgi:hypothetical protein